MANPFQDALTKVTATNTFGAASDINTIVAVVIKSALSLVGVVFLILMVYGGYLWMTARGESEQHEKAKNVITAGIIGLAITLGAYVVTNFVVAKLLTGTGVN